MASSLAEVMQLVSDAKLVVGYGVRTGRLTDNALLAAIDTAEVACTANRPQDAQPNELSAALNRELQAIKPVTLLDLGSSWRPFPTTRGRRAARMMFIVFAICVMFTTGYYTQVYTQTNAILGQLTDIQKSNIHDKSERLFHFFQKNYMSLFGPNPPENDALVFEPYLASYETLLNLNAQADTYLALANDLNNGSTYVPLVSSLLHGVGRLFPSQGSNLTARSPIPSHVAVLSGGGSSATFLGPVGASGSVGPDMAAASPIPSANATPATPEPPAGAKAPLANSSDDPSAEGDPPDLRMLTSQQLLLQKFLFRSGIDATFTLSVISVQISACQKLVALLGSLVLPALYGLLGGTISQMRAILEPMVPDPSLERLLLRLALSAFAGVSIFWLFGPTPQQIFAGTSSVVGPFGLAFFLGFGIDVFFSVIDRFVSTVAHSFTQPSR